MMNYIIWKNKKSTDIKGLIISELPYITKPKMRIKETIIDGVDGSLFENLGYESYDKKIKIGLTKNYNIDEIIKYFDGESDVVFSNESDKYYKAKIISQIDYARLLRFKEAIVTFKVQPYKYKLNEDVIELTESGFINNFGLEESRPILKIKGSGTIEFILNDYSVFLYTFPENEEEVIIDSEKQDAYLNNELKNRNMIGDFPIFSVGENKIDWNGEISSIIIETKSRWL